MSLKQALNAPFRVDSFFPISAQTWVAQGWQLATRTAVYYDRLDQVIIDVTPNSQIQWLKFDPLMLDNTSPVTRLGASGVASGPALAIGEWDQVANVQKIYSAKNVGQNPLSLLEHAGSNPDLAILDTTPFAAALNFKSSPGASALIGHKTDSTGVSGCAGGQNMVGNIVIFETAGYALQSGIAVRHTDNAFYCAVLAQIDLTTGRCDPTEGNNTGRIVPDIPLSYVAVPTQFQTAQKFGDEIFFDSIQFDPDNDSTPAVPKGRLIFSASSFSNPALTTGVNRKIYVKIVEWNPTGVSPVPGNPNRVQAREIFFSRATILVDTEPESGGVGSSSSSIVHRFMHHPPTETLRVYSRDLGGADSVMDVYELAAVFDALSAPSAEQSVETGKVTTFSVSASGDLGEAIVNRPVDWSSKRASSFKEALDTAALGPTSTLANPPIDDAVPPSLVVRDNNAVVLSAPADFTIVGSTGVITWAGVHPQATSGYDASYDHRTNTAAPSHGTLLNTRSNTDTNGKAIARMQYPANDELVTETDEITAVDAG